MGWWIKVAGTGEAAYTQERWDERRERMRRRGSGPSLFPKRPRIAHGDRLVVYASGSAALYGDGRFIAIEEVVSHEPEASGHERWCWRLDTRLLAAVDDLAAAPALREIGVSAKSLRQHSHIRLSDEQGRKALRLVEEIAERRAVGHGEVVIRVADPSDIPGVLALWERARSPAASLPDDQSTVAQLMKHTGDALLVAEHDGQVVGALVAAWDGWRGNMYRLAVLPEFRRGGIARLLVDAGHEQLRAKGAQRVTALVARDEADATGLWRAAGYDRDDFVVRFVTNL